MDHYIITGGCGFLGTWILKQLLDQGHGVTVFDLQKNTKRWEMILSPEEIERVEFRSVKIEETQDAPFRCGLRSWRWFCLIFRATLNN
jgi:nucleoside-diphosphate-sugar epimerase